MTATVPSGIEADGKPTRRPRRSKGGPISSCGRVFLTIDHVVPRSRGGSNKLANCVLACHRCNNEKGDRLLDEWAIRWYHPVAS